MRICKLKNSDKRLTIEYAGDADDGKPDRFMISSAKRARPEFYARLTELRPHLLEMWHLDDGYGQDLVVTGVTYTYTNGVMGAVITGHKLVDDANAPLHLSSPHKVSMGGKGALLTPACAAALEAVADEAIAYVEGRRDQMFLFDDEKAAALA